MGCEIPIGIIILDRYTSLHQVVTSASIIAQRENNNPFDLNLNQSKKDYSPPSVYIPDFIMSRKAISETIKRVGTPPPELLTSYLS